MRNYFSFVAFFLFPFAASSLFPPLPPFSPLYSIWSVLHLSFPFCLSSLVSACFTFNSSVTLMWWFWCWLCEYCAACLCTCGERVTLWWLWGTAKVSVISESRIFGSGHSGILFLCVVCCVAETLGVLWESVRMRWTSSSQPESNVPQREVPSVWAVHPNFFARDHVWPCLPLVLLPNALPAQSHSDLSETVDKVMLLLWCWSVFGGVFLACSSSVMRCSIVTVYCPPPKVSTPILYFSLTNFRPR